MEKEKNPATPWFILEFSEWMSPKQFKAYCDAHPEEVAAVRKLCLSESHLFKEEKSSTP